MLIEETSSWDQRLNIQGLVGFRLDVFLSLCDLRLGSWRCGRRIDVLAAQFGRTDTSVLLVLQHDAHGARLLRNAYFYDET
jgi:hypothetical protein